MSGQVQQRSITIVGAGIAGLTLAASLDPAKWSVTLIEAEPERITAGSGVGIWPANRRILQRLGVWEQVAPPAGFRSSGAVYELSGRALTPSAELPIDLALRPALMSALEAAVPAHVQRRTMSVSDPASLDGDVVVGADGVRSAVRSMVAPRAAQRVETPYVTLRGLTPTHGDEPFGEYWGPGRLFGFAAVNPDIGYWFAAYRSTRNPENLALPSVLDEARNRYRDAAPTIRRLLDDASVDTIVTRLWSTPPMPRYVRGRYIVIGDAAHAALPNLGRGACDAMLDAYSLAHTLNNSGSLLAWQARRLPLTQAARLGATAMMRIALLGNGSSVRNHAMRTIGRVL